MSTRGDYTVNSGLLSYQFDDLGNMYWIGHVRSSTTSAVVIVKYEKDLTTHSVMRLWADNRSETITNCQLYRDVTGVYRAIAGTRSNVYVYSSNSLEGFSPESEEAKFPYAGRP